MSRELNKEDIESIVLNEYSPTNEKWASTEIYDSIRIMIDQPQKREYCYKGQYNPETNTPDLISEETEIKKDWTYIVECDGEFLGKTIKKGDILVSEKDEPLNVLENWDIIKKNIENEGN